MGGIPQYNKDFSKDSNVLNVFEHCAQRYAHDIALSFKVNKISYQELNENANQLAHFLSIQNIERQSLIVISMDRSIEMIVAILATIKIGCAYVPVDPKTPVNRIKFILNDTKSPILLTQLHLSSFFKTNYNLNIIEVDGDWNSQGAFSKVNPQNKIKSKDLVYCIYTSGSTGNPKGVLVEHRNLINLISSHQKYFIQPVKNFLFTYSFAFDGSVILIFKSLLAGATISIAEEGLEKDIHKIAEKISTDSISHLLTFPSLYSILLENVNTQLLTSLESVSVAGETCPGSLVKLHHKVIPDTNLFNEYGPTEATVGTTIYKTAKTHHDNKTPIGLCINNTFILLLDENLAEVKQGTIGEIYIGGKGVARGYLNRPELTAQKFIKNPLSSGRLFKTGDLARMLPDGNLDFIGRKDFQVKLRGYRIELGEIESILLKHKAIRESVVIIHGEKSEDQKLIAYLVPSNSQKISSTEIRLYTEGELPAYMIPSTFIFLDKMPLSLNGKVDRKALAQHLSTRPKLKEAYLEPSTELELLILKKWSALLNIDQIGLHDKFFELGGNSLLAARFITEIQTILEENIFITSIFENPTIASFAKMLEREYASALGQVFSKEISLDQISKSELSDQDFQSFQKIIPKHPKGKPAKNKNKPAIFILAPPRSGTTLLSLMLAGHPNIFAANELQLLHFDDLGERAKAYQGKFSLWKEGAIRALMDLKNIDANEAKTLIQLEEKQSNSTQAFYAKIQALLEGKILVDKSPSYLLDKYALGRAEDIFEDALYIHLYRHPYSMIKSFEKMRMNQVMYLEQHQYTARQTGELIWQQSHQNALQFLEDIPKHRQFNISYEALIVDPETVMRNLCTQFGLPYHPGLISPYEGIEQKMVDGIYKESKAMGDPHLLKHGAIKASHADIWKGVFDDNFLHEQTWKTAKSLGYLNLEESQKTKILEEQQSKNPLPIPDNSSENDIAIIGMSARFPGAKDLDEFWNNLITKKDISKIFSEAELKEAGINPKLINDENYIRRGMYLEDADCFDADFFGYLPKEAALMDPQHRVFLECAYSALEDAGYNTDQTGLNIGVFGGVARNTYLINNVLKHPNYFNSLDDFQIGITLEKDFPATRVAYKLNLKGPAVNVQTACSTSGVAVHLACQSIRTGDADIVLVGGGRIQPPIASGHIHKEGHALSPDGFCRTFDADANGMVRGHGMAFIVLKNLKRAKADGDHIHAVIKGTAINNDGSDKVGFTAPSIQGQSTAILKAYKNAGINPETISYIEAHGTGTAIGDPIEIAGLNKAFSVHTDKKQFCHIGSVKPNIGHLDAGASIAGIIKIILALKHETLPPLMHFKKANPQIDLENSPFKINQNQVEWKSGHQLRRAGISSFGLGGTNAHIVLEEAPSIIQSNHKKSYELILFSAKKAEALEKIKTQYAKYLSTTKAPLNAIAQTLQMGRKHFQHRAFFIANSPEEGVNILQDTEQSKVHSRANTSVKNKIVFMFPGGGAQYSNMGFDLFKAEPVFRNAIYECLEILKKDHQVDLFEVLYPQSVYDPYIEKNKPLTDPLQGITLLFTIEYATAKLWDAWGIKATELIGHSLGEYTAACISGVFSLRDALALVTKRGKLFLKLESGKMLSAALSPEDAAKYLSDDLSLAAINKPDNCVFSGHSAAIDSIHQQLEAKGIQCAPLHISVAAHSIMIEPILKEFELLLNDIKFSAPQIPIISNVTGKFADDQEIQSPAYWLKHLRQTVRFSEGIETLLKLDHRLFLEVGPGQTLSTFARQHPARNTDQIILASLRHPKEIKHDYAFILKTIGQLWLSNVKINWEVIHQNQPTRKTALPTYPFDRNRYWINPKHENKESDINMKQVNKHKSEHPKITRKVLVLNDLKEIFHKLSGINKSELNKQASFLELGFDSLFLTQVVAKIKKKFPVKINFRQLFEETPNLHILANYVDQQLVESYYKEDLERLNNSLSTNQEEHPINDVNANHSESIIQHSKSQDVSAPAPAPVDGTIQSIIQQQLQLMQQQLILLGGQAPQNKAEQQITTPISNPLPEIEKEAQAQKQENKTDKLSQAKATQNGVSSKVSKNEANHGPWQAINKQNNNGLTDQQENYLADLIKRYTTRTKGSQALTQSQRKHLADPRSITGFNRQWKDMIYQIAVERSKGSKIWDVDGNEYIDYRNAFGISLFGHTPSFIQEAVRAQLDKGIELGVLTPLAKKVADLLCELSACERVTLVNTGSEALVAALRAARTVTMKDKVIVFEGNYHGIADEMLARPVKINGRTKAMPVAPGIPDTALQNVIILNYEDPQVLEKIKAHVHEVAAIIIEPIQPNNPCQQPKELFHNIRKITLQNEVALIFDEMITGFRIAMRGAQEWYGIEADLIAYGKIISGGLPMAAVAGKAKYMDAFDGGQWNFGDDSYPEVGLTFFGGTFVKHPLSLAAAYAALNEIKNRGPKLYEALNEKTAYFAEKLKTLFLKTKAPLCVHSSASIVAIKITDNNPLSYLIFFYLRLKGIHIKEKAALISTEHSMEDLDHTVDMFEESIKEMQTAGFFKITVAEVDDHNLITLPPSQQTLTASATPLVTKKKLALTEGQKEIWVEQQLSKGAAAAYNLSTEFRFFEGLKIEKLQNAFQKLINRHEALRTSFSITEPVQFVHEQRIVNIPLIDISDLSNEQQKQQIESSRFNEGEIPIDIFNEVPFRIKLIKVSEQEFYFYFTTHHIIADGWSMGVLINDLAALFTNECGGHVEIPEPRQISSFVKEQETIKGSDAIQAATEYWKNQFKDGIPVLEFPTDLSRPTSKTYTAKVEKLSISKTLYTDLKAVALQEKMTFFNLIYTAFQVFVHRLSHQDDFVIGITSATQANGDNPYLVAHGVNLLPIRLQTNATDTFSKVLSETRHKILHAYKHQDLAFGTLLKALRVPRSPDRTPIISILFNMDSPIKPLKFHDVEVDLNPIQRNYETFDVFVNIKPSKEGCIIEWIYNTDLLFPETAQRRLKEFETLLQSIVQDPQQTVGQLNILPEAEKKIIVEAWNNNIVKRPDHVIHQYLEEQAVSTPDRIAVSDAHQSMTYHQLNQRANQVAHYFVAQGVHTGNFIGVCFERSVDMIVALMACMKIGAIYVPLDPVNPTNRLKVIIDDAQANFLITVENLIDTLPSDFNNVICLDRDETRIRACSTSNLFKKIDPDQLVYVNYTSGSTGKPKGVLIPHYAVVDHHLAIIKALNLGADEKIFSVASIAFDPSVQDFFLPLMIGAQVYIASHQEKTDGFQLKAALDKVKPTLMQATPSTWRLLLMANWEGHEHLSILCGGEGLSKELSNKLISRSRRLYNIYGPTETTIWSTLKRLEGDRALTHAESSYEPIGRPIENVQIYLLDNYQKPVPIGVAGEVYIGGIGVAPHGYFKRDDLNAEKFIANPFSNTPGDKLYRTGDMARYLVNGDLEYLNRADTQVKIRGFRIELGEIESAIDQFEGVQENIVIIREDKKDDKRLVAYCIPKQGLSIDFDELKKHLKSRLPDYMIPLAFVKMDQFPLTATMKVNRNKLPLPEATESALKRSFVPAESDLEKVVEKIWSALLDIPKISIDDDFFELGGHSLIAVNMITLLEKETGKKLPLATLLENSSIKKLARLLEDDQKIEQTKNSSLVPIRPSGSKTPLYIVHGAGLHVLMFQMLASHMDSEQPIFALQARGLNGEAEPLNRMEDIAAHYINEILEQNPDGPYALAGYSFGGLIAFEMAKQLKAMGKEVKMLAMFDTIVRKDITNEKEAESYYKKLATLGKKVAWNISSLAKNPIPNFKYKSYILKRKYQRWAGKDNVNNNFQEADAIYGGKVDLANKEAFDHYSITPYAGKIDLFKAEQHRFYLDDFKYLGWKPYALGGIEIHTVPGDHLTLFDPNHGKQFAEILQNCLNESEVSNLV